MMDKIQELEFYTDRWIAKWNATTNIIKYSTRLEASEKLDKMNEKLDEILKLLKNEEKTSK